MNDQVVLPPSRVASERGQLSDDAGDYLRELIVSGQIAPGSRMRPDLLADALGISATPAREALQALRVEGFLRLEPRRGFTIAPLSGKDIRDVFIAQGLLAGELAARACTFASASDVRRLEEIQHQLQSAADADDVAAVERLNHDFHRAVNLLGDAPKISAAIRLLSKYAPRRFYASIAGWKTATLKDHEAVLVAFSAGDDAAARAAMTRHINNAGELLARHFDARMQSTDQ